MNLFIGIGIILTW